MAAIGGRVSAEGGRFSVWLYDAWFVAFVAVAGLYYFVLEAVFGQTVGKRMLGVQVYGADRSRPSAWAIAGRTVLRVVDFLPMMYLVGFITMLAHRRPAAADRRPGGRHRRGAGSPGAPPGRGGGAAGRRAAGCRRPVGVPGHLAGKRADLPGARRLVRLSRRLAGRKRLHGEHVRWRRAHVVECRGWPRHAASLHFVRGYDVTYDSISNDDSIEVTLFQFATPADAAAFKTEFASGGGVTHKADPVIPGGSTTTGRPPIRVHTSMA
jgi:RDD family